MAVVIAALSLAAGRADAHGQPVMAFSDYKPRIWHQFRWTNRALDNRCRPLLAIGEFTRYPLIDVSPWWRDERVEWATRKHKRAQAKSNLCEPAPGAATRALGQRMAATLYGWTGYQWDALDEIVTRESGWNKCRHYPSTTNCSYAGPSACGIPQSYPCSKLLDYCNASTIGACPARVHIRWMLNYIRGRYGSPAKALANGDTY